VTPLQDRAAGTLLGLACGDALGAPYEFDRNPLGADERPTMLGRWSDDTAMAVGVAGGLAAARRLEDRLDAIAERFLDWHRSAPADIGHQTRSVLAGVAGSDGMRLGDLMRERAAAYGRAHPGAAGNGALMRTAPVALAHLDDRAACARAARAVAALTHAGADVADSCVLWTEAVRVAVTGGGVDLRAGLDLLEAGRRRFWRGAIAEASAGDPGRFRPNGWTVRTLQAAYGAMVHADLDLEESLAAAIRIGDDTDTVAAVAGALLGAHHGASALPQQWLDTLHGWPGYGAEDLHALALALTR
jgi:ADP-ribosylglycohydrolase